ncbi:EF hand [Epibacterium ulvae]|uniref:EF hand n=1 Tax=Epibacterium ulvae TaxID=1156985 RepID=A0A1G5R4V3_9RHOB|nr:EF-hand domain-containing protein [Epibacterium ulvae]SCZ68986.1 EF hand [Epibacterium ulvae]
MNKVKLMAVLVTAASIVATGAVIAKPGGAGHQRLGFEQIDTDGNGELSRAELDAVKAARFSATDSNGDGQLSLEEISAKGSERAAKRAEKMMKRLDSNEDGQLSQDELSATGREGRMFARLDADKSGAISKQEFEEARKHRHHKKHPKGDAAQTGQN